MRRARLYLLAGITLLAIIITLGLKPIPQTASYHHFCDTRALWGIANFANVISNLPFVIIGIAGLGSALKRQAIPTSIRASYIFLFIGIAFTGIGSAYYHLSPNNDTPGLRPAADDHRLYEPAGGSCRRIDRTPSRNYNPGATPAGRRRQYLVVALYRRPSPLCIGAILPDFADPGDPVAFPPHKPESAAGRH